MNIKPLLSSIMLSATVIAIAGCTTNSANTNSVNENTNTVVANSNENTNADQGSALDTSDWLTYTNEEYGFSLDYPKTWVAEEGGVIDIYDPTTENGVAYKDSLTIEVTNKDFETLKTNIEESDQLSDGKSLAAFDETVENIIIDGVTALTGSHATAIGVQQNFYYIPYESSHALYIEFYQPYDAINGNVESVIETLKFGDAVSATDTSDWLTYTNEEYGFSLKYPGDWTADIINEGDEGGMGTSLGDIILYSNACEVTGTKLKTGSVDSIKKDLLSRGSTSFQEINVNGIKGVKYINVVNEDGDEGTIYSYVVNENEFSFAGRNRTQNDVCQTVVDSIIMSISLNS